MLRFPVGDEARDFEEVEHTADWALHVRGRDLPELLINAARGMNQLLVPAASPTHFEVEQKFELDAFDAESLLVEWLSELAYWAESARLIFRDFELSDVTAEHMKALARGGHVDDLRKHIKAVTYHNLRIVETGDGLETTVVFDV